MKIKLTAAALLTLMLSACNQSAETTKTAETITPWHGPWLFWEGQLRVHALQFCDQKWQINSADIWQQGTIALPCDKQKNLQLNTIIENKNALEKVAQWLALPSSDYTQSRMTLLQLAIIDEQGNWQWHDGRVVLIAGALTEKATSAEDLWHWHQLDMQAQKQGGAVQLLLNRNDLAALAGDVQFNTTLNASLQQLNLSASDAFGLNSEWGRWLRQQSVALKYNDVLFSNVAWNFDATLDFADVDSIASTLRMGLHTRFRLYSDALVAQLYAQLAQQDSDALSNETWQALQEQWQVKQWITQQRVLLNGVHQVSESAWLWQNGKLQEVKR